MSNPCSSTMTGPSPPLSAYSMVPAESSVSCLVIPCGLPLLSNATVPASFIVCSSRSFLRAPGSDRACVRQPFASWTPPEPNRSVLISAPRARSARRGKKLGASRCGERGRELRARVDRELAVDARQVDFDRPLGDEERLRDLAVRGPFGCHLGHTPLARRQRLDAAQGDAAGTRTGGEKLALGPCGQGRGAADRRQLDRVPKLLAGIGAAIGPAKRGAQVGPGLRVLEPGRRPAQNVDGFHEELEPALAALDEACRTQGGAERPRGTPRARERDLFL